jgi:hypothetical protein
MCVKRERPTAELRKLRGRGGFLFYSLPSLKRVTNKPKTPKKKINKKKQSKEKKNLPRVATNFPFFFFFFFYCLRLRGGTPLTRAISRYNTTCSRFGLLGLPLTTLDIYTGENLERQKIKIKRSGRTCDQLFTHFVRSAVKERKGI